MIALCFSANEMALTSGIHGRGTVVSPLEQPQSLRRWGCSRDPHSSQHLSKHCSNVPSSKGSGFSFCAEQSQRADTDTSQCFAAEVAGCWLWDNNLLSLFSLFENNNSCWGVLARGRPWLCVIYAGYVCSQQRSEREQINASPEALVLCCYRWALVPRHFPRSSSTCRRGSCSLAESLRYRLSAASCVCAISTGKDLFEKLPQRALQNFQNYCPRSKPFLHLGETKWGGKITEVHMGLSF